MTKKKVGYILMVAFVIGAIYFSFKNRRVDFSAEDNGPRLDYSGVIDQDSITAALTMEAIDRLEKRSLKAMESYKLSQKAIDVSNGNLSNEEAVQSIRNSLIVLKELGYD